MNEPEAPLCARSMSAKRRGCSGWPCASCATATARATCCKTRSCRSGRAATYQRTLGSARGWIYTVVRHRAPDEVRRAGRETPAGDALEALVDATADRHAIASAQASAASLEACLQTLDERRRD